MRIKKLYTYSNSRQLWRLLPTDTGNIVIEERDLEKKEVFFSCISLESGKSIFSNYQFDEKYWIGIETVKEDLILFHRFVKPDLPAHKGISVFDSRTQTVLWETDDYNYLFIDNNNLYVYRTGFEGKEFFLLDLYTGKLTESFGDNSSAVNALKQNSESSAYFDRFSFPSSYLSNDENSEFEDILGSYKNSRTIAGKIDYLPYKGILMLNFHEVLKQGTLRNTFIAIDIDTKRIIFEEILNAASTTIMPDSFFMIDNYLLLLKEKIKLVVCTVTD